MKFPKEIQSSVNERFNFLYNWAVTNNKVSSKREFCYKAGINEGNFQKYYTGERNVNSTMVVNLVNSLGVSYDWFVTGKGEMLTQNATGAENAFSQNSIANSHGSQIGNIHGSIASPNSNVIALGVEIDGLRRTIESKDELIAELRERIADLKEQVAFYREKAK